MDALKIENLSKTYADHKIEALKGINLTVEQGDFFALLGPNGAGKSTTIGIITSLVTKTTGKVEVFGYDLDKQVQAVKSCIGVVPQEFNFSIFEKIQQILIKQAGFYGIPQSEAIKRSEKYLKALGLWEKRDQRVRFLSGGQKRRLMIARALIHEPPLLILDEPTAGVDIELRRLIWRFIQGLNDEGKTIILTTHYLEEAESLCKNIAIIDEGRLIEHNSMSALLRRLKTETFILYLANPLHETPDLSPFSCRLVDEYTLEVDVSKGQPINQIFQRLSQQEIKILSMKNKVNRLEELFLNLTGNHHESSSN
jgi:ABC-2 type transport system ATP-binding protein